MAYGVAKELSLRPYEILNNWTCEELLVAYGVYANQHSSNYYDMLSKKDRRLKKMTSLDRWAMPFVSQAQLERLAERHTEEQQRNDDLETIAQAMFG